MNLLRIALHAIRIGLLVLLILQCMQMLSALWMLSGPDAFTVSPYLWAALIFKFLLLLVNTGLLWLAHCSLRAPRTATSTLRPTTDGDTP